MEPKLILATTSIWRQEAFNTLNIPYEAVSSNFDEKSPLRPKNAGQLVKYLAREKALAVADQYKGEQTVILGFDSVGKYKGAILEKPTSGEDAKRRLLSMSGRGFDFYTGIYAINTAT